MEIPSQSTETIKIPTANYEFGANFIDPKVTDLFLKGIVYWIMNFNLGCTVGMDGSYVVDAFWENNDWWEAQCKTEVWFNWKSSSEGERSGEYPCAFVPWMGFSHFFLSFFLTAYRIVLKAVDHLFLCFPAYKWATYVTWHGFFWLQG